MSSRSLTLNDIPEELAREFENASQELLLEILERGLRERRIDRALEMYRQGGISFGAAAERAGVSQSDLARSAYARGMKPSFDAQMLLEELGEP